jgi:hypothetical protein
MNSSDGCHTLDREVEVVGDEELDDGYMQAAFRASALKWHPDRVTSKDPVAKEEATRRWEGAG